MIRAYFLIASLAIMGSVCLTPLGAESLSEKAKLEIRDLHYDGPTINPSDHNTASLYVRATVAYEGLDEILDEKSRIIAGCWMNTEEASSQTPGKDWSDWQASCFNNDWVYSPDYPRLCGEHLIDRSLLTTRRLTCQNGSPGMPRCFQSTKPNRFIGWATGGASHLSDDFGFDDVNKRRALPPGEIPCQRYFFLRGSIDGLEIGDQLKVSVSAPNPQTGAVEQWSQVVRPDTGVNLFGAPQVADGASYSASLAEQPEKKTCTFKRNGASTIQATFVNVDDQGRTRGGLDLTDLSIACVCKSGETSCPPDADLLAETVGLRDGEAANVRVEVQFPNGESDADTYAINRNGGMRVIDNLPAGSTYSATFQGFSGRESGSCTITDGSGTMDAENATFFLDCSCPSDTSGGTTGNLVAASSLGCDEAPGGFQDILPVVQIFDICEYVARMCPTLDPWWWGEGPPTGNEPCQRQTVCVDGPPKCWTDPVTGEEYCGPSLVCTDQCMPQSRVVLDAPLVALDGDLGQTLSGEIQLSGWASDADGIQDLRLYLDGEPLTLEGFRTDVPRPEACGSVQGDCTPVGFEGVLDTTAWSDGVHRLVVFAVDNKNGYPMPTFHEVDLVIANTCTSTAPPTGELLLPADGALVSGTVLVEAQAAAENGVERVRFYLDGNRVSTDWSPPYRWSWATGTVEDGLHTLHAEVLDTCGGSITTTSRTVTVANQNDPPSLALEAPTPLVRLSGVATVLGWAVDADAIASVSLRLGGQTLPLASPVEWVDRADVCNATSIADPRCPRVGWRTTFDTTLWPDGEHAFKVVVLDERGAAAMRSTTVVIRNAPEEPPVVRAPVSRSVVAGEDVSFSVTASGEGPFEFQWQYRSGTSWVGLGDGARSGRVTGAWSSMLKIGDVEVSDQTSYRCLVTSPWGTTASSSASLTVHEVVAPPTVTAGLDQRVTEGETAALSVSAQGVEPLSYRWQKWIGSWVDLFDDAYLSGAASPLLTIHDTEQSDSGSYRCRVSNAGGTTFSDVVALTVDPLPVGTCQPSGTTLCFQANRFTVTATVNGSQAQTMPFSQEGAFFWVFEPQTVEVVVKILDGTSANGHFWVFHGSLTDLAYTVTVTDTITGISKSYLKSAGHFCGEADTAAFGGSTSAPATAGLLVPLAPKRAVAASSTPCASSPTAACLLDGKFKVEVLQSGAAQPGVSVTDLSASFGFVTALAPEVVVKLIDGTSVNGWYWLFFGSLTHQNFTVRVTDSSSGMYRTYTSPGQFCGGADTTAF